MEFERDIAIKYGVKEAIVINCFKVWIETNRANDKCLHRAVDNVERTWMRNSIKALQKTLPFWSSRQIQKVLKSIVKQNILITHCFKEYSQDRILSYAFKNEMEFLE